MRTHFVKDDTKAYPTLHIRVKGEVLYITNGTTSSLLQIISYNRKKRFLQSTENIKQISLRFCIKN